MLGCKARGQVALWYCGHARPSSHQVVRTECICVISKDSAHSSRPAALPRTTKALRGAPRPQTWPSESHSSGPWGDPRSPVRQAGGCSASRAKAQLRQCTRRWRGPALEFEGQVQILALCDVEASHLTSQPVSLAVEGGTAIPSSQNHCLGYRRQRTQMADLRAWRTVGLHAAVNRHSSIATYCLS